MIAGAAVLLPGMTAGTGSAATDPAPGSGPLDGMAFAGMIGPEGKPKDIHDTFVFADGNFVSMECEARCQYPARPYYVRTTDEGTEFYSVTRCPYKDAEIVWRGTVSGDRIEGVASWTVNRWYWTIENRFKFSGRLTDEAVPIASAG